jgi:hypothetical protein
MSGSGKTIIANGGTLSLNTTTHQLQRVLQNGGTATKQGAGTASFSVSSTAVAFNNSGTVDVQGDTLGLDANGTQSSDFAVASGATLRLNGTHTLSAASDITGAGGLGVAGGTITHTGTVNLGGTGTFSGGTATFTGSSFAVGVLAITGGTANVSVSTPVSFSSGTLSSGALVGSSDVTCTGLLLWSGGTMSGSGKTIIANGGTLNPNTTMHQLNRVLQNGGTATWTAGQLQMSGGTFNNNESFTANSSAALDCYGTGGVNAFNNAGTFTKQGAGTANFSVSSTAVAFNNSGTASLAGALNVALTNGFYPPANASFTFLTAATRTGTFATFNYPSNDVGLLMNYTATNASAQVINVRPALPVFANQTNAE